MIFDITHYETGTFRQKEGSETFLPDPIYSRCLDVIVKACADILVQDSTTGEVRLAPSRYPVG